jgi:hypothetical protein
LRGVPLRDHDATPRDVVEPALPTWSDVEIHLAHYESILRSGPELADNVFALAANMIEFCDRIPGSMPANVRAAFARLGVSMSSEDE